MEHMGTTVLLVEPSTFVECLVKCNVEEGRNAQKNVCPVSSEVSN